jgi:DNA polymerase-3 subunit epsilon
MSKYQKLIHKLKQNSATIDDLMSIDAIKSYFVDEKSAEVMLGAFGLPIEFDSEFYSLRTSKMNILEQEYCFVDIETNGSNPTKSQIIEIAAVKSNGTKIIDTFDSMVYCNEISEMITEITGINSSLLKDKPEERVVLENFRVFLSNSVFVAHNVDFDFGFITQSMQKYDLPPLLNRKFCTIDLAKKTIEAQKYGLKHLAELLNLEGFLHHRAYSDALASFEIFKKSLENLPQDVVTVEDLIDFSTTKHAKIEGEEK